MIHNIRTLTDTHTHTWAFAGPMARVTCGGSFQWLIIMGRGLAGRDETTGHGWLDVQHRPRDPCLCGRERYIELYRLHAHAHAPSPSHVPHSSFKPTTELSRGTWLPEKRASLSVFRSFFFFFFGCHLFEQRGAVLAQTITMGFHCIRGTCFQACAAVSGFTFRLVHAEIALNSVEYGAAVGLRGERLQSLLLGWVGGLGVGLASWVRVHDTTVRKMERVGSYWECLRSGGVAGVRPGKVLPELALGCCLPLSWGMRAKLQPTGGGGGVPQAMSEARPRTGSQQDGGWDGAAIISWIAWTSLLPHAHSPREPEPMDTRTMLMDLAFAPGQQLRQRDTVCS